MNRTLENCSLMKQYGKASQPNGKCEGLGTEKSDEPCEKCKECKLHYLYGGTHDSAMKGSTLE